MPSNRIELSCSQFLKNRDKLVARGRRRLKKHYCRNSIGKWRKAFGSRPLRFSIIISLVVIGLQTHLGLGEQHVDFTNSPTYQGSRPYFVFRTASRATGYYVDRGGCPLSLDSLAPPAGTLPPIELRLDSLLLGASPGTDAGQLAPAVRRQRPSKGKAKAKLSSGTWKARSPLVDLDIEKTNDSHRDVGLWAFDTVNANSWTSARKYLDAIAADICRVQETRLFAGDSLLAAEQVARSARWNTSILPGTLTPAGGRSVGVAVSVRSHIGMSTVAPLVAS